MRFLNDSGLTKLVQLINERFATTNSPTFSGTPTAPTASSDTNNTQIATTAFVQSCAQSAASSVEVDPISDATIQTAWNNITPDDAIITYAPIASPNFTGAPTAPTATSGSNGEQIANTAFVAAAVADEATARATAVSGVQSSINTEISDRQAAITNLQNNVVTVTTAQDISGTKTFTDNPYIVNTAPRLYGNTTGLSKGTSPSSTKYPLRIYGRDANGNACVGFVSQVNTSGTMYTGIRAYNFNDTTNEDYASIGLYYSYNGDKYAVAPDTPSGSNRDDNSTRIVTVGYLYDKIQNNTFCLARTVRDDIASGDDLNTYVTRGTYNCSSGTIAASLSHCPHTSSNFTLLVMENGTSTYVTQMIFVGATSASGMYYRTGKVTSNQLTSTWYKINMTAV